MTEALVRRSPSQILLDDARQLSESFDLALKANDSDSEHFRQLGPMARKAIERTWAREKGFGSTSLWGPIIGDWYPGAWQRNDEIHPATALQHPTVFACVRLIQQDLGKMRLRLMEERANGVYVEIQNSAYTPVLRKPNHYQTRQRFIESWMNSKLIYGNTYILKQRDGRGVVSAMYVLDPSRVKVLVAPDGSVFYELSTHDLAGLEDAVRVPAREIIHDLMPAFFHQMEGVSPLYAAMGVASQGLNIQRSSSLFFANGSQPGGVLTSDHPIPQDAAQRAKTYWETEFSGQNAGKVAVLGSGLKYTPLTPTKAADSQLAEQINWIDEKICSAFGMPPHKVGVGDQPNYNNIEALNQQYWSECLQPHSESITALLSEGLDTHPYVVQFDLHDLLQMDTEARVKAAAEGIRAGFLSPNEVRAMFFGLGGVDGGESVYLQHQDIPIAVASERESVGSPVAAPADKAVALLPAHAPLPEKEMPLSLVEFTAVRDGYMKLLEQR